MAKGELHVELTVNYADDEKLTDVSRGARLLYVDALCLCKRVLNDGALTVSQVEKLAYPESPARARRQAAELVDSGAWVRREGGGYQISAWLKRNKSRAQVEAQRSGRTDDGSQKASYGNHIRWHARRGTEHPDCEFCASPGESERRSPGDPQDIATGNRPAIPNRRQDIATGNRPAIPNYRSETETETETRDTAAAIETHVPQAMINKPPPPPHPEHADLGNRAVAALIPPAHPTKIRKQLAAEAAELLANGTSGEDVTAALARWLTHPNAGPRLLPSLVSDVIRERNGANHRRPVPVADQRIAALQALKTTTPRALPDRGGAA